MKCDRCFKFYDRYTYEYNMIQIIRSNDGTSKNYIRTLDLCKPCMSELLDFMKGGKSTDEYQGSTV